MSMMLKVYTQENCHYCGVMIKKLAEWGLAFDVINITNSPYDKIWLKERHHKTVPVVYVDDFWLNEGIDTEQFTEEMFYDRMDALLESKTPDEVDALLEKYDAD